MIYLLLALAIPILAALALWRSEYLARQERRRVRHELRRRGIPLREA